MKKVFYGGVSRIDRDHSPSPDVQSSPSSKGRSLFLSLATDIAVDARMSSKKAGWKVFWLFLLPSNFD